MQADGNFAISPWAHRLSAKHQTLGELALQSDIGQYDLCVCNPPFFSDSSPSHDLRKRIARHCSQLTREHLVESAALLLKSTGRLCVVIPFDQLDFTCDSATEYGLHLRRQTCIRPFSGKPFKRVLLEFALRPAELLRDEFSVRKSESVFSKEYEALTHRFHLRFANR